MSKADHSVDPWQNADAFAPRHIGPGLDEQQKMLKTLGTPTLDDLVSKTVPQSIRLKKPLQLERPAGEAAALAELARIASSNQVWRTYIGMGYHGTITPAVIKRNILENPGWYTQYTPYQAEISQGRLEAILNFQTMICDLTGLPVANGSLLDESTAAAEAMGLCLAHQEKNDSKVFFVSHNTHPQTISVVKTRAEALGVEIVVGDVAKFRADKKICGVLVQSPAADGSVPDVGAIATEAHKEGTLVVVAADILSLILLKSPGEQGADIAVGSTQRFGVPLGLGGPHAAYMATRDELKRKLPGRIVGVSKDRQGRDAIRLALQTREQHIRRDKATSNICTAQVLLAVMASMYAVYHGPEGLKSIASRVATGTDALAAGLKKLGHIVENASWFDTLTVRVGAGLTLDRVVASAAEKRINFAVLDKGRVGISLDETVTSQDIDDILRCFTAAGQTAPCTIDLMISAPSGLPPATRRKTTVLAHPIFHRMRSETEMMRYIRRLESKDLSLTTSMIPLGSCTMKLNAASELAPLTWPEFGGIHPFAPAAQWSGYRMMMEQLGAWLAEITGFDAVSLQPNAGSQGEYAGLLAIRHYHKSRGDEKRSVCLIPQSAHGTNPASAVMAGMKVVVVACDKDGNIDLADLRAKTDQAGDHLSALMVTYPSTHGVFEESISEVCAIIHKRGGQVYMDGANMNAQVGLCRPGDFGPDVCHLNLHKTFCIPPGGGGPGMGPIAVKSHLASFLPGHPVVDMGVSGGAVSAAPYGSASILTISWMYIRMMGESGLKQATEVAILNANYIAKRLDPHFPVLYKGRHSFVAHECIVDLRGLKATSGVEVEDVAKRLMDYGFHAPTVSFPVPGTMMIEPTESESKAELDRFCDAMIAIRDEIRKVESGTWDKINNPLKNAPHTMARVTADNWDYPYSRTVAGMPAPWLKEHKFWPAVARIDNAFGDRNLVCTCPPLSDYA